MYILLTWASKIGRLGSAGRHKHYEPNLSSLQIYTCLEKYTYSLIKNDNAETQERCLISIFLDLAHQSNNLEGNATLKVISIASSNR